MVLAREEGFMEREQGGATAVEQRPERGTVDCGDGVLWYASSPAPATSERSRADRGSDGSTSIHDRAGPRGSDALLQKACVRPLVPMARAGLDAMFFLVDKSLTQACYWADRPGLHPGTCITVYYTYTKGARNRALVSSGPGARRPKRTRGAR